MDQSGDSADHQSAADRAADVVLFPAPPLVATVDGRTWELGPLTNIVSLHRVVAGLAGVPRVAALIEALSAQPETVRIEASTASDLLAQLEAVRSAIVLRGREGTAIVDQTPRRQSAAGFSRTWAAPDVPELLAANRETGVVVDPKDGLVVLDRATGDRRIAHVVEADLRGEVVVVTNRVGESIELVAAAARPLAWIVPTSLRWKSRSIPEVVVWSSLFSRLPDALSVAATMDGVVSFTTDPFTIDSYTIDPLIIDKDS
jgi:hypothetical protein